MGARHDAAEDDATAGVAPQELDEIASDAVEDEVGAEDLTVGVFPADDPGEQEDVEEFDHGRDELGRLERHAERRLFQGIAENHPGRRLVM